MQNNPLGALAVLFATLLLVSPACLWADNTLGEAETLVLAGKGARAYPLLVPLEARNAGNPHFDRLLGLAALAAGEAGHATLALERVVIVEPDNARAHLELARAYVALGDNARAVAELDISLALNPTPEVERNARRLLAGMQAPTLLPRDVSGLYAELGFGYDSNINSGPSQQTIYLPFFGLNAELDSASMRQGDSYGQFALGGQYRKTIGAGTVLSASLDAQARRHSEQDSYDPFSAMIRLGVGFDESRSPKRFTLFGQRYDLGEARDYLLQGVAGEWLLPHGTRSSAQLYGRYSQLRYGDSLLESNDYDQAMAGLGWLHAVKPGLLASITAYGGAETEVNLRADGDSRLYGLRAALQYTSVPYDIFGAVGVQSNDYDRPNIIFSETRADRVIEAALGLIYRLTTSWSLRPKFTYVNQGSNIAIHDFSRYDVSLAVRYDVRFH